MPADFPEAVAWKIRNDRATDAKSQPIKGMLFLRVDDYLLDRLRAASTESDSVAGEEIPRLIARSHDLAAETARAEIGHLSDASLREIWKDSFQNEPVPKDLRYELNNRHARRMDRDYAAFAQSLSTATVDVMRSEARRICDQAEPSIKSRRGGGLLVESVRKSHSNASPSKSAVVQGRVYEPGPLVGDDAVANKEDADTRKLLEQLAPEILQEARGDNRYETQCDMIGAVHLGGRRDHIEVDIQTDHPSVYAFSGRTILNSREHVQLSYCYWFPEHPPTRPGDPEAGPIDGATIRITLDADSRPAIIEAVQNCGCHYRCFAATYLDDAARKEFGPPPKPELSSLTRPDSGAIEVLSGDLFKLPDNASIRPVIISPAAYHVPVGIQFAETSTQSTTLTRHRYDLLPYEMLENMPTDFGRASMFGADGLVHNAGRGEGWLLAGTGMLSAGQPRQRGTQLICWDKHAFDDPHLLENILRLPRGF
ncbi:MAG: hypothetical protein IPK83_02595 [Planctomycetes bacterium]|nr:hypothetical protein [Planctomycetota bacterium]